jgi:hypothetical protein
MDVTDAPRGSIMTESEWLVCADRVQMLDVVVNKSDRKLLLFACACIRRQAGLLTNDHARQALEAVERFADDLAGAAEVFRLASFTYLLGSCEIVRVLVEGAGPRAWVVLHSQPLKGIQGIAVRTARRVAALAEHAAGADLAGANRRGAKRLERLRHCQLLRCIFGNPFHSVSFKRVWRSADVRAIAAGLRRERNFDQLPILGDALEDAGCTEAAILRHLRGPGPHACGCWAVDLVQSAA